MIVEMNVKNIAVRIFLLLAVFAFCALLVWLVINQFIVGALADQRLAADRERLAAVVQWFPDSSRLNAGYAQAELIRVERDLEKAFFHADRAVKLSPYSYRNRLLLGSIEEARGDRAAAEQTFRKAVQLAPTNTDAHWQYANALLRQKKLEEALPEFRFAAATRSDLLPSTLDLIWRVSNGNIAAVEAVTAPDTKAKLALARFLVEKSQTTDAVRIYSSIERDARLREVQSGAILDSLINAGSLTTARQLWIGLVGSPEDNPSALIWNGSFEADVLKNFAQFDWNLTATRYARLSFDSGAAHSGSRSLKIDFVGEDTTRLDNEIKQIVLLTAGANYRLTYWIKTGALTTPEGPRVVLTENRSGTVVFKSEPLASGTLDWKRVDIDFVAPPHSNSGLSLSIKRIPKFSYDEPTRGAVWFDDFSIAER